MSCHALSCTSRVICTYHLQHSQRQYYNANGSVRYSGTGYWLVDLDMNSPRSVESIVPEVAAATPTVRDCERELYCGLPYLMPVTTFLWYVTECICAALRENMRYEESALSLSISLSLQEN